MANFSLKPTGESIGCFKGAKDYVQFDSVKWSQLTHLLALFNFIYDYLIKQYKILYNSPLAPTSFDSCIYTTPVKVKLC